MKKENLKCKYCTDSIIFNKNNKLSDDLPIKVYIDSSGYLMASYNGINEAMQIIYCPVCGRKLKEECKNVR